MCEGTLTRVTGTGETTCQLFYSGGCAFQGPRGCDLGSVESVLTYCELLVPRCWCAGVGLDAMNARAWLGVAAGCFSQRELGMEREKERGDRGRGKERGKVPYVSQEIPPAHS